MAEFLREEDFGASMREPIYGVTVEIPLCNACIFRYAPGKCKLIGDIPKDLRYGDRHDCPDAVLNTKGFTYPQYQELHPDVCEKAKKQE